MPFRSHRVLAFESRRAAEMETLIRNQGGDPFIAPAMREVPIENNPAAFAFAEALFSGRFDIVILLTGVGTRYLDSVLCTRYPAGALADGLRSVQVICRGPKPLAVCREWNIPVAAVAPEPNTYREILDVLRGTAFEGTRIAIQEYGKPIPALKTALEERGAIVHSFPVYQWALPEDLEPLREAVRRLARREFDAALFTTATQVDHLIEVSEREKAVGEVRAGLDTVVIASIGPTTSETLEAHGISPDFVPSHPKMGMMVVEFAREIDGLIAKKRSSRL